MDIRKSNIIFNKNKNGSLSPKLSLSNKHIDALGITQDDKEVEVILLDKQIIIRKKKTDDLLKNNIKKDIESISLILEAIKIELDELN